MSASKLPKLPPSNELSKSSSMSIFTKEVVFAGTKPGY